jgi:hypothetical protein
MLGQQDNAGKGSARRSGASIQGPCQHWNGEPATSNPVLFFGASVTLRPCMEICPSPCMEAYFYNTRVLRYSTPTYAYYTFLYDSVVEHTRFSIAEIYKVSIVRVLWRTIAFLYDSVLCTARLCTEAQMLLLIAGWHCAQSSATSAQMHGQWHFLLRCFQPFSTSF